MPDELWIFISSKKFGWIVETADRKSAGFFKLYVFYRTSSGFKPKGNLSNINSKKETPKDHISTGLYCISL